MARHTGPHLVQCYYCRHRFEVGGRAQSTSCPGCNKALHVADETIDRLRGPLKELRTCGRILIKPKGRLIAEFIEAHGGIECHGILDAKRVLSGSLVQLDAKCQFKANLTAPGLAIKLGARVHGLLSVPDDPLGLSDLP